MSTFKPYREGSRTNWGSDQDSSLTIEQINCGALLRIADATELMAKRYQELINQREQFERSANYWRAQHDRMQRRLIAAKGQITKLKKARSA